MPDRRDHVLADAESGNGIVAEDVADLGLAARGSNSVIRFLQPTVAERKGLMPGKLRRIAILI
jgi:hypothetical protein